MYTWILIVDLFQSVEGEDILKKMKRRNEKRMARLKEIERDKLMFSWALGLMELTSQPFAANLILSCSLGGRFSTVLVFSIMRIMWGGGDVLKTWFSPHFSILRLKVFLTKYCHWYLFEALPVNLKRVCLLISLIFVQSM